MSKQLTHEQLNALEAENGCKVSGVKNYRGLVRLGLLRHKWGNDASFGYDITEAGKRAIKTCGKL